MRQVFCELADLAERFVLRSANNGRQESLFNRNRNSKIDVRVLHDRIRVERSFHPRLLGLLDFRRWLFRFSLLFCLRWRFLFFLLLFCFRLFFLLFLFFFSFWLFLFFFFFFLLLLFFRRFLTFTSDEANLVADV